MGDHSANGDIECAVRELKRQMRAIRFALEQKLQKKLSEKDPILSWIPTFAGDVLARYRRGKDGKTAWERETGRRWKKPALEFGEAICIRGTGARKSWEERVTTARYIGHHSRTGSVMGLTAGGVIVGSGFQLSLIHI